MKTIKVYTARELKKKSKKAFECAHESFKQIQYDRGLDHADEIISSFKDIFDASGVRLLNYEIDSNYPSYSYARFSFDNNGTEDLYGQRALAWIENNLFAHLREHRPFLSRVKKYEKWHDFTKYGNIPDCPFTGVCYDDDMIESLLDSIKQGYDLKACFNRLAIKVGEIEESEWVYQLGKEYFLDESDANEYLYTIDGKEI
jgi:hypothetical protein